MKRVFLFGFANLCLMQTSISQIYPFNNDSASFAWQTNKEYNYSRLHLNLSIGPATKFNGNMFEAYEGIYTKGLGPLNGSFYGAPQKTNQANGFTVELGYALSKNVILNAFIFPEIQKKYVGGNGVNGQVLWVFDTFYKGNRVEEDLITRPIGINGNYVFVPYKEMKLLGLECSGGLGIFYSKFKAKTTLWAYDTLYEYDSTNGYQNTMYEGSMSYDESKPGFGVTANVKFNFYVGRYVSIFAQGIAAISTSVKFAEKNLP